MFNIKATVKRFGAVLDALDALADSSETLEDLNAELEDALLMLSELKPEGEGWREEWLDALEDIRALAGDYRRLTGEVPDVGLLAGQLEKLADEAAAEVKDQ